MGHVYECSSTKIICVPSHFSRVLLFVTPWTVAHQTPLSWDSPGKNTGVGFHVLLQGIFPTQGANLYLYVVATSSGKQIHSEGQCRWWSAVYYTSGPKAQSPLSQGPRPVFVKTLYTLSVRAQTHLPKFSEKKDTIKVNL